MNTPAAMNIILTVLLLSAAPVLPAAELDPTPSQSEGPYYPVEKPADRDSDLTRVSGTGGTAEGRVVVLEGVVRDRSGEPLPGVTVEIWQTDAKGIYLHPRGADRERRDRRFQSYGESKTGADGTYRFRTVMPGAYGSRPRHIHVKLRHGDRELLTTQFYFPDDDLLGSDGISRSAGDRLERLLVDLDSDGEVLQGRRDVVLDERTAGIVRDG